MINTKKTLATLMVAAAFSATPVLAESVTAKSPSKSQMQAENSDAMVRTAEQGNTWITLTGEVTDVDSKFFTLEHDEGHIFVELGDTDLDAEAYENLEGEEVMVTAQLTDALLSEDRVTAKSVYLKDTETTYLAKDVDQASADLYLSTAVSIDDDDDMVLVGTVKSIGREAFQLQVGESTLTIDVEDLDEGPIDDDGMLTLSVGERVRVTAELEDDFFDEFKVEAERLTKMKS